MGKKGQYTTASFSAKANHQARGKGAIKSIKEPHHAQQVNGFLIRQTTILIKYKGLQNIHSYAEPQAIRVSGSGDYIKRIYYNVPFSALC